MIINGREYRSVWYEDGKVKLIDQTKLPVMFEIYEAENYHQVASAINNMIVRGAPAIGAATCYGIALADDVEKAAEVLGNTRPTAHDLFFAINYMLREIKIGKNPITAADEYVEKMIEKCKKIGEYGNALIKNGAKILTHCNAGALATVDYGTALAPIRVAHNAGKELFVFVDETRPRLQGFLTAWELGHEKIDYTIIVDNAAGHFMRKGDVDLVIVGADRIAKNGDAANKIGTYEKAVLARENGIPFYMAAPTNTIDLRTATGNDIEIEERDENEVLEFDGKRITPTKSTAKNPTFDVTPAKYITGIITENGIIKPHQIRTINKVMRSV